MVYLPDGGAGSLMMTIAENEGSCYVIHVQPDNY
jgi:hypothetical protein